MNLYPISEQKGYWVMDNNISFEDFITSKPLFYKEIDHQRVHNAYNILKPHIHRPLTIHIVGTNGKGSTGRIMAMLLHKEGKKIGHFSSPHILKFNERIWIEGEDSSDELLEEAHQKLYGILEKNMSDALSYFEYTTLLALVATQNMDVMILEAGLGGEFDATNIVRKELSVITPIGLDHQDFLGNTVNEIALTKLNSIDKRVILARQPYREVYEVLENIQENREISVSIINEKENKNLLEITQKLGWAYYLYENALLSINALTLLDLPYSLDSLKEISLFGRFYSLSSNLKIDVGHNVLAVRSLIQAIKKEYGSEKIILVYNSLEDKDYETILRLLKPFIKHVEIIEMETSRSVERLKLEESLRSLKIEYKDFQSVNMKYKYFIFGSFYVVEAFLNKIKYRIKNK